MFSLHILHKNAGKGSGMEDFAYIKANAWSLRPGEIRGKLVAVEKTKYGTNRYYYDESDNSYWYASEGTEKFHKEMKEKEKERKRCSRESKSGFAKSREQSA